MFMKTPWYVSYNCLFGLGCSGTSNGICVEPAGILPGPLTSQVTDTS